MTVNTLEVFLIVSDELCYELLSSAGGGGCCCLIYNWTEEKKKNRTELNMDWTDVEKVRRTRRKRRRRTVV